MRDGSSFTINIAQYIIPVVWTQRGCVVCPRHLFSYHAVFSEVKLRNNA